MYCKAFVFAAVVACAFAADSAPKKEEERVKKDVLLGTVPYAYAAVPSTYAAVPSTYRAIPSTYHAIPSTYASVPSTYAAIRSPYLYDDGKYYPGKYEKAYIAAPAVSAYSAAVPAYAAVPAVSSYHVPAVPSYVAEYPYVKSYVY